MQAGERWRLGHRPALDGLRGVAVLLVVADHAGFLYESAGSIGVTIFFVLSGFLITRLIVEAREDGKWSLRRFYWNRAVRLVPALYIMVVVVSVAAVIVGWPVIVAVVRAFPPLLYLQNYVPAGGLFQHTWSLAVEEQFYLLWPLALPLLLRSRRPLAWIVTVAAASMLLALSSVDNAALPMQSYGLLAGCALGIYAARLPRRAPRWAPALGFAGVAAAVTLGAFLDSDALAHRMVSVPFAALLIWSGSRLLEGRALRFLGRISYAVYLWHLPLLSLAGQNRAGVDSLPMVVLAFGVATASTLWLEEPLRRRLRKRHTVVEKGGMPSSGIQNIWSPALIETRPLP